MSARSEVEGGEAESSSNEQLESLPEEISTGVLGHPDDGHDGEAVVLDGEATGVPARVVGGFFSAIKKQLSRATSRRPRQTT